MNVFYRKDSKGYISLAPKKSGMEGTILWHHCLLTITSGEVWLDSEAKERMTTLLKLHGATLLDGGE